MTKALTQEEIKNWSTKKSMKNGLKFGFISILQEGHADIKLTLELQLISNVDESKMGFKMGFIATRESIIEDCFMIYLAGLKTETIERSSHGCGQITEIWNQI
jgi:hypothetical protein